MSDFYTHQETRTSRELYGALANLFPDGTGATVIGGWAVFELTDRTYQQQSRDVDIVFSTKDAFNTFRHEFMKTHRLEWAGTARRPTNACRFQPGAGPKGIAVDVFFLEGTDACQKTFHTAGGPLWKDLDCQNWLPRLDELLLDKLTTLPLRGNQDAGMKRLKDAVDAHALIFSNNGTALPMELRATIHDGTTSRILKEMANLRSTNERAGDTYSQELDELERWLTEKSDA